MSPRRPRPFPGAGALILVLLTALVIARGCDEDGVRSRIEDALNGAEDQAAPR